MTVRFDTSERSVVAVKDLGFHVRAGEVLAIVGESGSGKSVTSLSVMRLIEHGGGTIASGKISFTRRNGGKLDLAKAADSVMRTIRGGEISMIFQEPMTSLNPVATVGDQIAEAIIYHSNGQKVSQEQIDQRVGEVLEMVGIPAARKNEYPHQFSGGMKQRVVIAMALSCQPDLLIADEPTTALDVTIQAQILELMMELKDKLGMAIIMITHDLGIVASMCEKIAVMYAGRIVEYGTTDEIFYEPKHEYTKGLLRSIPKLDAREHEKLVPIEGTPIDLLNPPKGCPFAPRCNNCMKICLREMPPVTTFGDVHYTQCWMNQKAQMEGGETGER